MSNFFITQAIQPLTLETEFDLSSATVTKILYIKPNGEKGEWAASKSGTTMTYNITNTDVDIAGNWRLQAYAEIGGKRFFGSIVKQQFKLHIK